MGRLLILLALCGRLAYAAEEAGSDLAEPDRATLRELMDQVRQLKARVQQLEAKQGGGEVSAAQQPADPVVAVSHKPALEEPPAMDMSEPMDQGMAAMHGNHSFLSSPTLTFHGYADLGFHAITHSGGTNSFRLGQADLFLTSKLSDKLGLLMETAVDSDADNVPGIEIERILLSYHENEYLNVDVGRYHTAIGYFNGAFHHGRWFQTAIDRPFLFAFEDDGGVLPIHNTGVSVSGHIPSGSLGLNYVAEIGNGRAYKPASGQPVQTVTDQNNGKAVNFALYSNPRSMPGWQFGASLYRDRLTADNESPIAQKIYSVHAIYVRNRVEFLNEGILMHHSQPSVGTVHVTQVPAFYTQFSYRLASASRPYFRYEFMNPAASDPVVSSLMGSLGYRHALTAGYRYDLTEFCAIKFQFERVRRRDLVPSSEGSVQLAFSF